MLLCLFKLVRLDCCSFIGLSRLLVELEVVVELAELDVNITDDEETTPLDCPNDLLSLHGNAT